MASAAEAELAAVYYVAQEAIPLRYLLEELGHHQTTTPITTDNATAHGLIRGMMMPRKSKAMDMRFHWLRCRQAQRHFDFRWECSANNKADYFSKHHPPQVHTQEQSEYLVNYCHNIFLTNTRKKAHFTQCVRIPQTGRLNLQGCAGKLQGETNRPGTSGRLTGEDRL